MQIKKLNTHIGNYLQKLRFKRKTKIQNQSIREN